MLSNNITLRKSFLWSSQWFCDFNYYNLLFEDLKINNYLQSLFRYLKYPTSNYVIKRYSYKMIISCNIHVMFAFSKFGKVNSILSFIKRHKKYMVNHLLFKKSIYFFYRKITYLLYTYLFKRKLTSNLFFYNSSHYSEILESTDFARLDSVKSSLNDAYFHKGKLSILSTPSCVLDVKKSSSRTSFLKYLLLRFGKNVATSKFICVSKEIAFAVVGSSKHVKSFFSIITSILKQNTQPKVRLKQLCFDFFKRRNKTNQSQWNVLWPLKRKMSLFQYKKGTNKYFYWYYSYFDTLFDRNSTVNKLNKKLFLKLKKRKQYDFDLYKKEQFLEIKKKYENHLHSNKLVSKLNRYYVPANVQRAISLLYNEKVYDFPNTLLDNFEVQAANKKSLFNKGVFSKRGFGSYKSMYYKKYKLGNSSTVSDLKCLLSSANKTISELHHNNDEFVVKDDYSYANNLSDSLLKFNSVKKKTMFYLSNVKNFYNQSKELSSFIDSRIFSLNQLKLFKYINVLLNRSLCVYINNKQSLSHSFNNYVDRDINILENNVDKLESNAVLFKKVYNIKFEKYSSFNDFIGTTRNTKLNDISLRYLSFINSSEVITKRKHSVRQLNNVDCWSLYKKGFIHLSYNLFFLKRCVQALCRTFLNARFFKQDTTARINYRKISYLKLIYSSLLVKHRILSLYNQIKLKKVNVIKKMYSNKWNSKYPYNIRYRSSNRLLFLRNSFTNFLRVDSFYNVCLVAFRKLVFQDHNKNCLSSKNTFVSSRLSYMYKFKKLKLIRIVYRRARRKYKKRTKSFIKKKNRYTNNNVKSNSRKTKFGNAIAYKKSTSGTSKKPYHIFKKNYSNNYGSHSYFKNYTKRHNTVKKNNFFLKFFGYSLLYLVDSIDTYQNVFLNNLYFNDCYLFIKLLRIKITNFTRITMLLTYFLILMYNIYFRNIISRFYIFNAYSFSYKNVYSLLSFIIKFLSTLICFYKFKTYNSALCINYRNSFSKGNYMLFNDKYYHIKALNVITSRKIDLKLSLVNLKLSLVNLISNYYYIFNKNTFSKTSNNILTNFYGSRFLNKLTLLKNKIKSKVCKKSLKVSSSLSDNNSHFHNLYSNVYKLKYSRDSPKIKEFNTTYYDNHYNQNALLLLTFPELYCSTYNSDLLNNIKINKWRLLNNVSKSVLFYHWLYKTFYVNILRLIVVSLKWLTYLYVKLVHSLVLNAYSVVDTSLDILNNIKFISVSRLNTSIEQLYLVFTKKDYIINYIEEKMLLSILKNKSFFYYYMSYYVSSFLNLFYTIECSIGSYVNMNVFLVISYSVKWNYYLNSAKLWCEYISYKLNKKITIRQMFSYIKRQQKKEELLKDSALFSKGVKGKLVSFLYPLKGIRILYSGNLKKAKRKQKVSYFLWIRDIRYAGKMPLQQYKFYIDYYCSSVILKRSNISIKMWLLFDIY